MRSCADLHTELLHFECADGPRAHRVGVRVKRGLNMSNKMVCVFYAFATLVILGIGWGCTAKVETTPVEVSALR